jgi:hypothetical protein
MDLRRALMRQVVSPPPCGSHGWVERAFVTVVSLVIACGVLSLAGAVLRMCEP